MRKPVLTIFYQYNPWHSTIGGIQTIITSFIKYAPSEFDVRLVGTGNNSTGSIGKWCEAELEGREIRFMPLFKLQNDNVRSRIPTTLKYTLALFKSSFSSDFMHFHRIEPTLAALRWTGDKTLFIHNDISEQMTSTDNKNAILWRRFPQAYFAFENLLIKQFNQIFSCNSQAGNLYRQRYPAFRERVELIKNTVDNEIFYPLVFEQREEKRLLLTKQLHLPEKTRFVLFAGRLHPQKDPLLLVRSLAALNEPNVHLLIAGDGELATEVQAEIQRLGLSKKITMMGAIQQTELADLHRLSDAFVLTSAYEGLPLVVLEALACGTPVVTTQCGETPNLLSTNSGVVCQERTPTAIADALQRVLQNSYNYPVDACVRVAQPYGAREVISDIYDGMLKRWKP